MEQPIQLKEYLDVLTSPAFIIDCKRSRVVDETIDFLISNNAADASEFKALLQRETHINTLFKEWLYEGFETKSSVKPNTFETQQLEFTANFVRGSIITHDR